MIKLPFRREDFESYRREFLRVWGLLVAIGVAALVATYVRFVEPPPPRRITIATGQQSGRYHAYAAAYREALARAGIQLELRETAGSAENLVLLGDTSSGVQVAFVQGGSAPPEARDHLYALASLYREPLWVFHRGERTFDRLTDLAGKRLSIGPEGSGTRVLARRLLEDNGITAASQQAAGAPLLGLDDREAAAALTEGRIDAAFFVVGPGSAQVQDLIHADGVRLLDFRQHESYARLYPYLTSAPLSEGLLDLARNVPPEPITLIAPAATLVANDSLHPALIPLLLQAATATHEQGNVLDAPGEFPSPRFTGIALHPEAKRILTQGQSFLYRFLPFWLASLLDRLKFMLVPLITVVFSIFKLAQPIYQWRIRSRIYRHYEVLRRAELELGQPVDPERRAETIDALRALEVRLGKLSVPLWSMEDLYQLYVHIGHVRRRLEEEQPKQDPEQGGADPEGGAMSGVAVDGRRTHHVA